MVDPNVTLGPTSPPGELVLPAAVATDNADPAVLVKLNPSRSGWLPAGVSTLSWTASDAAGRARRAATGKQQMSDAGLVVPIPTFVPK